MPDSSKMIIVRPHSCHYCGNGYNALGHVTEYAYSKNWNITEMTDDNANKGPILSALLGTDAQFYFGFGHGSETTYTGDSEQPIFQVGDDLSLLSGRDIYLLSCLTANLLGTAIVQAGAEHYAGYNISWTWEMQGTTDDDPYTDFYGKCYWESANELWIAICDGATFEQALQRCIAKYNEWIEYWYQSEDPSAIEQIGWLLHDRDGLVMLTPANPNPPAPALELDWHIIVPTVVVVGIALFALLSKDKKKSSRHKKH